MTFLNELQFINELSSKTIFGDFVCPCEIITVSRDLQFSKAIFSTNVEEGIVMLLNEEHSLKAPTSILHRFLGRFTSTKL